MNSTFNGINTREIIELDHSFKDLKTLQDIKQRFNLFILFILNAKKFSKTDLSQVPLRDMYKFITDAKTSFYENVDIGLNIPEFEE